MSTVRFLRSDLPLAQVEVPGQLLEINLPVSVSLRRTEQGFDLIESSDPWLECCGRLAIPWMGAGQFGVTYLDVPPPEPFTEAAVTEMWKARERLELKKRPPTSGNVPWAKLAPAKLMGVSWPDLSAAVDAALGLLGHWPQRQRFGPSWGPLERGSGRILAGTTERSRAALANASKNPDLPGKVARSHGISQDVSLAALTTVSLLVAQRIARYEPLQSVMPGLADELAAIFRRVAVRSRPTQIRSDPPASTWPARMRASYASSLRLLTVFEDVGPGESHAPLTELWELYEAWVSERLIDGLTMRLGAPTHASGTSTWTWSLGSSKFGVVLQPVIPAATSNDYFDVLGSSLMGVVASSRPDILYVAQSPRQTVLKVLDAKKRKNAMIPEELTVNASKYLWNVRHVDAVDDVAIEEVLLVSPLGGPSAAHQVGRALSFEANPTKVDALPDELMDRLMPAPDEPAR